MSDGMVIAVVDISADQKEGTLEIRGAGAVALRSLVSAGSLETILAALGRLRASLVPEVPRQVDAQPGKPIEAERVSDWAVQKDAFGEVVIHLRDARFGWLHYIVSKAEAAKLAERLAAAAAAPAPVTGKA